MRVLLLLIEPPPREGEIPATQVKSCQSKLASLARKVFEGTIRSVGPIANLQHTWVYLIAFRFKIPDKQLKFLYLSYTEQNYKIAAAQFSEFEMKGVSIYMDMLLSTKIQKAVRCNCEPRTMRPDIKAFVALGQLASSIDRLQSRMRLVNG